MNSLLSGAGLFAAAFLAHVTLWRINVPQRQASSLAFIFLCFLIGGLLLLYVAPLRFELPPLRLALAVLLYGSLCAVYFILFSAVEENSPTLSMITIIYGRRARGVQRDDLLEMMRAHRFTGSRVENLLRDHMVVIGEDGLRPGPNGRLLAATILGYRRLLGRERAGG